MPESLLHGLAPEQRSELKADVDWLIEHPEAHMGSKYHDAGSCWMLIAALLAEIRELIAEVYPSD